MRDHEKNNNKMNRLQKYPAIRDFHPALRDEFAALRFRIFPRYKIVHRKAKSAKRDFRFRFLESGPWIEVGRWPAPMSREACPYKRVCRSRATAVQKGLGEEPARRLDTWAPFAELHRRCRQRTTCVEGGPGAAAPVEVETVCPPQPARRACNGGVSSKRRMPQPPASTTNSTLPATPVSSSQAAGW